MPTTDHGFFYPDTSYTSGFVTALAAASTSWEAYADATDLTTIPEYASSAARATAFPTPTTGQLSRISTERFVRRYNGTSWVPYGSGSFIVVPASVSGTGASVDAAGLITMAATPTLNVITGFPTDFTDFQIRVTLTSKSSGGDMIFRLRTGGTDSSTNYINSRTYGTGTTTVSDVPATTSYNVDVGGATRSFHIIEVSDPNVATPTSFLSHAVGTNATFRGNSGGLHTLSTAYPDFTLTVNGAITLNGTVEIIGINRAT